MAGPSAANDAVSRIQRFYKTAEVASLAEGFGVNLDGRSVKTPAKAVLALPTRAAAELVAAEWEAQGEHIDFARMPATRHAFTAIDRVSVTRAEVAKEIARYAAADLLCYFADQPESLVARQLERWGPVLDWALTHEGLVFVRATGVSYQAQPVETLARMETAALALDDFHLAALAFAGALFGSSILALAVLRGRLSASEAFDLARIDEAFQEEQWGRDEEAAIRTANQRAEADALTAWLEALATR
jgi:chaperone required for assembly of F1-ATPase